MSSINDEAARVLVKRIIALVSHMSCKDNGGTHFEYAVDAIVQALWEQRERDAKVASNVARCMCPFTAGYMVVGCVCTRQSRARTGDTGAKRGVMVTKRQQRCCHAILKRIGGRVRRLSTWMPIRLVIGAWKCSLCGLVR